MGACLSHGRHVPIMSFVGFATTSGKLSKEQIAMVNTYLPDFLIHEKSTELHRQLAASHWNRVFNESHNSITRASQSYSVSTRNLQPNSEQDRRDSVRGTPANSSTHCGSRIGLLFDHFYNYLDQNSPELKPLFRFSLRVKGRILVYISAGMRSILASEHVAERVNSLTKTHLQFGVQLAHFNPLGKALLYAMEIVSDDTWTAEVANAWRRLFAHCSAMLMVNQKKMLDRKAQLSSSRALVVAVTT